MGCGATPCVAGYTHGGNTVRRPEPASHSRAAEQDRPLGRLLSDRPWANRDEEPDPNAGTHLEGTVA